MGPSHLHVDCVDRWLATTAVGATPAQLDRLYAAAFEAIWQRSHAVLGEVTLTAIVERVVTNALERDPSLGLAVGPGGITLTGRTGCADEALRSALIELLSVLGSLTAEILTPALHAELSRVALGDADSGPGPGRKGASP